MLFPTILSCFVNFLNWILILWLHKQAASNLFNQNRGVNKSLEHRSVNNEDCYLQNFWTTFPSSILQIWACTSSTERHRKQSRMILKSQYLLVACTANSCAPYVSICWKIQWQRKRQAFALITFTITQYDYYLHDNLHVRFGWQKEPGSNIYCVCTCHAQQNLSLICQCLHRFCQDCIITALRSGYEMILNLD